MPPWSMQTSTMTAPAPIERTISRVTSLGAMPPGTSTAPMRMSASLSSSASDGGTRHAGGDALAELGLEAGEALEVRRADGDARAEGEEDAGGGGADVAAADDERARGRDAGDAAEELAAAGAGLLQELRGDLGGHAPRHLAHRDEQRQRAVGAPHGLVGDGVGPRLEERAREIGQRARGGGR